MGHFNIVQKKIRTVFIGHGDEGKCLEFASTLNKKYGFNTIVPQDLETIRLA